MTVFEKIHAMNVEEFAKYLDEFISRCGIGSCAICPIYENGRKNCELKDIMEYLGEEAK